MEVRPGKGSSEVLTHKCVVRLVHLPPPPRHQCHLHMYVLTTHAYKLTEQLQLFTRARHRRLLPAYTAAYCVYACALAYTIAY
jgi:hypothetical protein